MLHSSQTHHPHEPARLVSEDKKEKETIHPKQETMGPEEETMHLEEKTMGPEEETTTDADKPETSVSLEEASRSFQNCEPPLQNKSLSSEATSEQQALIAEKNYKTKSKL